MCQALYWVLEVQTFNTKRSVPTKFDDLGKELSCENNNNTHLWQSYKNPRAVERQKRTTLGKSHQCQVGTQGLPRETWEKGSGVRVQEKETVFTEIPNMQEIDIIGDQAGNLMH